MIGIFFGNNAFKFRFGNIEFDANLEEVHEWKVDATLNPVEEGSPITDHIIQQPDKLRVRGMISDAPLNMSANVSGIVGQGGTLVRTQPVFDLLRDMMKARETVTVYTKHQIYLDMVIANVIIPRAAGLGESLEFIIDFINIRLVATQTVSVPEGISASKSDKPTKALGNKTDPQKDAGKKQPVTVDASKAAPTSALFRLFGGAN